MNNNLSRRLQRTQRNIVNAQKGKVTLNSGRIANNQNWQKRKRSGLMGSLILEMFKQKGLPLAKVPESIHDGIIELWFGECLESMGSWKICIPNLSLTSHRIWHLLKPNFRDDSVNHSSIITPQIQQQCIYHYSFCNLFPLENQNFHYGAVWVRYQGCFGWTTM